MGGVNIVSRYFVLFVFGFIGINAQSPISQLENYFHQLCLKNSQGKDKTEAFNKLRADVYEMSEFFQYSLQLLPDKRKDFCKDEIPRLKYRIKNIETDLKACLPSNDNFLASFTRQSFEEFLRFLCSEHQSNVFSSEVSMCREKIESSQSQDLDFCLNRIFPPTNGLITKKDMCEDLSVARKCIAQLLEQECKSSQKTKDLNQAFFDYIERPCSGCGYLASATYVLMLSMLLHYFN